MKAKLRLSIFVVPVVLALLMFGCTAAFTAILKDGPDGVEKTSVATQGITPRQASPVETKPSSPMWRTCLWDSIPPNWLQGNFHESLLEAYQQNDWKPLFLNSRFELTEEAKLLIKRLERVEQDAIDPRLFHLSYFKQNLPVLEKQRLALQAIDPNYQDTFAAFSDSSEDEQSPRVESGQQQIRYAMNSSSLPPVPAPPDQTLQDRYRDVFGTASGLDIRLARDLLILCREMYPSLGEERIKALTGSIPMSPFLESLEPKSPHYKPLVEALAKYRGSSQDDGLPAIPEAASLKMGDTGDQVRNLQKRLQAHGFYKGKVTGTYDAATRDAVKSYEHSQSGGGSGDRGSRAGGQSNTGNSEKARLIAESIKLIRQSQTRSCGNRYVRVNIPELMLEYYRDGKIEASHRVIVGKASGKRIKVQGRMVSENNTPTLSSNIERIIINPRWYVSDRIMQELSDDFAADPTLFAKRGYVAMNSSSYPWGGPRIFQKPGPNNPLGQVKFEFPNAYAVFIHDTPKRQLFANAKRDLSHGCIRVDRAKELAIKILSDDNNAAVGKIDSYYSVLKPTHINLNEPLPIIVEYIPVTTDHKGHLVFTNDIYGWFKQPSRSNS